MSHPEFPAVRYEGYVDGIDVSSVQGRIDWEKVAGAGFRFVVIKVSEGSGGLDPRRLEYLAGARDAGMTTLAYHFAHVRGDPAEQVETMRGAIGDRHAARVALDLESAPAGVTHDALVAWALAFAEQAEFVFGQPPLFYTYPAFASLLQPIPAAMARCPLWVAHYMSTKIPWVPPQGFRPRVPSPWTDWTMHQYSGNGGFRVPGIQTDCDRDLFQGDEEAFALFCGAAHPK